MIEKPLDQIEVLDLQALISSARAESRSLDYKLKLPGPGERDVKGFLADVSALANTDGGDIVYGVREDGNGIAKELVGIDASNLDEDIRGFEARVRDCIDPRLAIRTREVPLGSGRSILVVRVPASLIAPHRATYAKSSHFYARNSRGNFEMDTSELRLAFAASGNLPRRMKDLHEQALQSINGVDMPCRLADEPAIVVTVAPLSALRDPLDLPITRGLAVLPPKQGGYNYASGLDGVVAFNVADQQTGRVLGWTFTRRSGHVDAAWTIGRTLDSGEKRVFRRYVEEDLEGMTRAILARLVGMGVEGPWIVMATLVGVHGFHVSFAEGYRTTDAWQSRPYLGQIIDDHLRTESLSPLIEAFWRVFGQEEPPPRPQS